MTNDKINRLFNNITRKETINKEDIETFIKEFGEFDEMFDYYFDEREEQIRESIEEMHHEFE